MSKEVLIPKDRVVNGVTLKGFDVINPLYCYEGGKLSFKNAFSKKDPVKVERAAIIVNRGWIPAESCESYWNLEERQTHSRIYCSK